jgi:hypothetical protein
MMVRLTDAELATVMTAARPIAHHLREAFLQAVADELARCGPVGRHDCWHQGATASVGLLSMPAW